MLERVFKSINNLLSESGEDDEIWPKYRLSDIEDLLLKKPLNALMETSRGGPTAWNYSARRWYTGSNIAEL